MFASPEDPRTTACIHGMEAACKTKKNNQYATTNGTRDLHFVPSGPHYCCQLGDVIKSNNAAVSLKLPAMKSLICLLPRL
mmetsp:Transcript_62254/g.111252  ORF Transcript_62254/g.111252 Transcript_62254/m.111252 type:complete len:80 (-) Transcript_62254:615-854(-)